MTPKIPEWLTKKIYVRHFVRHQRTNNSFFQDALDVKQKIESRWKDLVNDPSTTFGDVFDFWSLNKKAVHFSEALHDAPIDLVEVVQSKGK